MATRTIKGDGVSETFLNNRIVLHSGDCMETLATLPENSVHAIVCDPPYHLTSIVKRFGGANAAPAKGNAAYIRASKGFMSRVWDGGDIAFQPELWSRAMRVLRPGGHMTAFAATRNYHRMGCAIEDAGFEVRDQLAWTFGSGFPKNHNIGDGWGTALKPAWEPICLARKPLSEKTVAANVLRWGTGAINVDGCRVAGEQWDASGELTGGASIHDYGDGLNNSGRSSSHSLGRWPANIIHDGSEEVLAAFPDSEAGGNVSNGLSPKTTGIYGSFNNNDTFRSHGDSGSAARFFYTAKADSHDRIGSKHPTVKPVDLMQWLVRLVTPKGGIVLDPFAGTGTTAEAAFREGMNCILIERESEYQADIRRRMALVLSGPDERSRESIKAKTKDKPVDAGPLFAGAAE